MDIEAATKLVASAPPTVSALRSGLAETHAAHPQRAMLADMAMADIEAALGRLASLGHHFHLAEGTPLPGPEWPKMMYSDSPSGLLHHVATSAEHQAELEKVGWRTTQQPAEPAESEAEAVNDPPPPNDPPSAGDLPGTASGGAATEEHV